MKCEITYGVKICEAFAFIKKLVVNELKITSDAKGGKLEKVWEWRDVLELPTMSENFGLAVAEVLERGKCVVTTDDAPVWESLVVSGQQLVYLRGFRDGSDEKKAILFLAAKDARSAKGMGKKGREEQRLGAGAPKSGWAR